MMAASLLTLQRSLQPPPDHSAGGHVGYHLLYTTDVQDMLLDTQCISYWPTGQVHSSCLSGLLYVASCQHPCPRAGGRWQVLPAKKLPTCFAFEFRAWLALPSPDFALGACILMHRKALTLEWV